MAADMTLPSVDQATFDSAEAEIVQLLREYAANLDLRRGTALRDLLVRPAAQFHALDGLRIDVLRQNYSLALMAENPSAADPDLANALLANLAYFPAAGVQANGTVAFYLNTLKDIYIPSGYIVADANQLQYQTVSNWTARVAPVTDPTTEVQIRAIDSAFGAYFFVLPMTAVAAGSNYNAQAGASLTPVSSPIPEITGITVYSSFTGGTDSQTLAQSLAALPYAVSFRAFESEGAITARLLSLFSGIQAVRAVGYATDAQLRDKHNLMGVAAGSKVDVYVRNYTTPTTILLQKTGTKVSDGVYQFTLAAADAPGFLRIRSVTPIGTFVDGTTGTGNPAVSSASFQLTRDGENLSNTFHEISAANAAVEAAFSAWQKGTVVISNVPALITGGVAAYPATLPFTVELYVPPQLADMQALADGDSLRNQEADQLIRGAIPCFVSLKATVYRNQSVTLDLVAMANALANFINTKNFNDPLTVSQLSAIFHSFNIVRVDLDDKSQAGLQLLGSIQAPDGTMISISGDRLDISLVARPDLMVTADTVVFAADIRDIFLTESVISA